MEQQGEIILYQPNEAVRMEVHIENETVWLTQAQIAELFGTEVPAMKCAAVVPNPSGMGRKRFPKLTLSFGPQYT